MKKLSPYFQSLLLAVLALLIVGCGKTATQEGLASVVFKSLKYNDFETYSKYIVTDKEAMSLLKTLEKSGQYKAYSLKHKAHFQKIKKSLVALLSKQRKNLEKNFYAVFDQGARHGITWSQAKFVEARIARPEKVFDLDTLKQQNIYIIFKFKNKQYTLRISNNIKVKRGWVIVDGLAWDPELGNP